VYIRSVFVFGGVKAMTEVVNRLMALGFDIQRTSITFRGSLSTTEAGIQDVTVRIDDAGPQAGDLRYTCVATRHADGASVEGGPAETPQDAMEMINWHRLHRHVSPSSPLRAMAPGGLPRTIVFDDD
jgi:hypothetical protein